MTPVISLRALFVLVLVGMLATIVWASSQCALFAIPAEVRQHPWFLTTLLDAYLAFLAFYVWVAWKEGSITARVLWFFAIMLWGNVAIAIYALRELARLRGDEPLQRFFCERRPGHVALPGVLTALAVLVYFWGARHLWA
jgi:hypothetical protein